MVSAGAASAFVVGSPLLLSHLTILYLTRIAPSFNSLISLIKMYSVSTMSCISPTHTTPSYLSHVSQRFGESTLEYQQLPIITCLVSLLIYLVFTEDNRVRLKFEAKKLGTNSKYPIFLSSTQLTNRQTVLKASGHRGLVAVFTLAAGLYFFKADLDTIKASSVQTRHDVHRCREELNKVSPKLETIKNDIQTLNQKVSGKCVTTASNIVLEQAGIIRKGSR